MVSSRIVEYVFFFGLMAAVGYLVWQMLAPFVSSLALAAIIVTICYPLHLRILRHTPRQNPTLAAFLTTISVLLIVILPIVFLTSALVSEAVSVFNLAKSGEVGFESTLTDLEHSIQSYVPGFSLNVNELLTQAAQWTSSRLGAFFASTASTIFLFFIALIGSFYFFRDGKRFTKKLVQISPLPDSEDEVILKRLAQSVRAVATGTVLVALIQGTLTALGLWIFGFERAILWGTIAAFGALIPSVGTSIVFIPAVASLLFAGEYGLAIGLSLWGMFAVGLIDNLLGPYLMSRGNRMHPFIILLAVLGGIVVFGPIGFVVGPVVVSMFLVLLELYSLHISDSATSVKEN